MCIPRRFALGSISRAIALLLIGVLSQVGFAQDANLAEHFGFDQLEILKIGRRAGPLINADMNGDGRQDLVVVNNHASRIEIHEQRQDASPDDSWSRPFRVNEFPEHWRFLRRNIPFTHRVFAVAPHDFDGDGLMDLIYADAESEIVFLRQTTPGDFTPQRRHRVTELSPTRDALVIADVLGDSRPELLAIAEGGISIWPLEGDRLGAPIQLASGDGIVALLIEDFNGDGRNDIVGAIPDDAAPLRLWFGDEEAGLGVIGAQHRFELPPIVDGSVVRLPQSAAARLAVIERPSRRLVVYEVANEAVEASGDRDAAIRVRGFTDHGNRERQHAVADIDGDGLMDLIATDTEANALVVYRQRAGKGLQAAESHPSLSALNGIAVGNVDADPSAEIFVISEKEGVVGRCDANASQIPFPLPINVASGYSPTAMNLVTLADGPRVAVVVKKAREYRLDLIDMEGNRAEIKLGKLSRSPDAIAAHDADQDGRVDLLLFTRDKPMKMLYATEEGFDLTESSDMGQFGLVKAADADNIASIDIDDDGLEELLIAEMNFVRAVRYVPNPPAGVSPGWQVVAQVNTRHSSSKLVSLTTLEDHIVAADQENNRLIIMSRVEGGWEEQDTITVRGFDFHTIHVGAFAGDGEQTILAVGDDGFAVVQLHGERTTLREVASWRSADEQQFPHELAFGDLNQDGYVDLVSLDAGEQICDLFTFTDLGRLLYATGFKTFESRVFSGAEGLEFEPSQALVVDVTGDAAADLVLLSHDRILVYPQMTDDQQ